MKHIETLTRYTANFVDELARNGLANIVISPGSRSTPLALTFAEHPEIQHWVNMDERSAAFFALGMAKQTNKPVAILCTSGTAAANYYPAVVEAYYSRIPLLVLTADRPHELRDVGAPQAIEQLNFYGQYVKWFHEMALPEQTGSMLAYVRSKAARAYATSKQGNAGPVHLNFPFREPLLPDFSLESIWGSTDDVPFHTSMEGSKYIPSEELDRFLGQLTGREKGLIVCGPQFDGKLAESISLLSKQWNLPVLADPLSQLRAGTHEKDNVIESYDAILKSEKVRDTLTPDFIIRFGAMPVSKPYLLFLKEQTQVLHVVVEEHEGYREPAGTAVQYIYAEPNQLCEDLIRTNTELSFNKEWLTTWKKMNKIAKQQLLVQPDDEPLTEGHVVTYLAEAVPDNSTIYVGNSMPVRDIDTFFMTTSKRVRLLGNRGANGIDGTISTALGAASGGGKVTLLLGDLSFFHDFNALLVGKQYEIDLTIILINNNGGGIFSFLPQANQPDHFETIFGTPLNIDFKHIVGMYGGEYRNPVSWEDLQQALVESYQYNGISVVEIQTDREENVQWHRAKWKKIEECLWKYLKW